MSGLCRALAGLYFGLCALPLAAQSFEIPRELWDRPRTGRAVLEQPNVREAVAALLVKPESQLVIHHAPAQEPIIQAEELRSWLIALAIEPKRIVLQSDAAAALLRLEIVP